MTTSTTTLAGNITFAQWLKANAPAAETVTARQLYLWLAQNKFSQARVRYTAGPSDGQFIIGCHDSSKHFHDDMSVLDFEFVCMLMLESRIVVWSAVLTSRFKFESNLFSALFRDDRFPQDFGLVKRLPIPEDVMPFTHKDHDGKEIAIWGFPWEHLERARQYTEWAATLPK